MSTYVSVEKHGSFMGFFLAVLFRLGRMYVSLAGPLKRKFDYLKARKVPFDPAEYSSARSEVKFVLRSMGRLLGEDVICRSEGFVTPEELVDILHQTAQSIEQIKDVPEGMIHVRISGPGDADGGVMYEKCASRKEAIECILRMTLDGLTKKVR